MAPVPGAADAAKIISLAAEDPAGRAWWEAVDEVVRGDHAREVLAMLALNAVAALRLQAERCNTSIEHLLLLGPAGEV